MKNPVAGKYKKLALVFLVLLFLVSLFLNKLVILAFVLLPFLLVLVALKKWDNDVMWHLVSVVVLYPVWMYFMIGIAFGLESSIAILVAIVAFVVLYFFIWREFWKWIDLNVKHWLMGAFVLFALISFAYMQIAMDCAFAGEKGTTDALISTCKLLSIKMSTSGGRFVMALSYTVVVGPALMTAAMVVNYFVFNKKK